MIVDYLMMFTKDEGQKLSAAAASDFRLDFGQPKPTTGYAYGDLVAVFTVKADVTGNLTISLQDSDTETSGFADVSTAVTLAAPKAGTQIVIPIPYHHKRYMQANFAGTVSGGTVHGFITSGFQDNAGFEQAPSIKSA
nr:MAG TPA: major capsid protein [Caudoviricetes sp.]